VREWGIEQVVRDARVAMIYEGTNEIQAQDLLFRKVLADGGRAMCALATALQRELDGCALPSASRAREGLAALRELVQAAVQAPAERLYPVAGDFMRVATMALMAWGWCRLDAAGAAGPGSAAFARWVWPELAMRRGMVAQALA
jgi:hypothetical protein